MSIQIGPNDLTRRRGCLCLESRSLNDTCEKLCDSSDSIVSLVQHENRRKRDGEGISPSHAHHLTVLFSSEAKSLQKEALDEFRIRLVGKPLLCLGIGMNKGCCFVVFSFPHAAFLRRKWGLPKADFHVTLGFYGQDRHEISKRVDTIREHPHKNSLEDIQIWIDTMKGCIAQYRTQCNKGASGELGLQEIIEFCHSLFLHLIATHPKEKRLIERVGLIRCRACGLHEDFECVIEAANHILQIVPTCAPALGYKGYAEFKKRLFGEALISLEEAQNLFQSQKYQKYERRAQEVDECIIQCCHAIGRDLPLPPLIKFPRTAHIFRPNESKAVTEDDVILTKDSAMLGMLSRTKVTLQEKVDGSNLGLSLSLDGQEILVQNRSHYLSNGEHPQYGPLASWISTHREALLEILDAPKKRSARHGWILYGEWMVARHSIPYHKLPGYFVAFDLFDITTGQFVSQSRLQCKLQGSGIPICPTIATIELQTSSKLEVELMRYLDTKSNFRNDDGYVEGVVFRIEEGDWLAHRGKLVRPDFVAGIDKHWSKRMIEKQTVDVDFAGKYLELCYQQASSTTLPCRVNNPRQRAVCVYKEDGRSEIKMQEKTSGGNGIILPRNLSWLWEGEVAISSTPKNAEQIQALNAALGVTTVITLTQEEPLSEEWFAPLAACRNEFLPVPNYCPPTIEQMDDIALTTIREVASGNAVMEHCGGGKGRAGTVGACLLLRFGEGIKSRIHAENVHIEMGSASLVPNAPFMTSDRAIAHIRDIRPGSIETEIQEDFVRRYAEHLWHEYTEFDRLCGAEDTPPSICESSINSKKSFTRKGAPKYVILMGLPGSGKSTVGRCLSKGIETLDNSKHSGMIQPNFLHAEQDDMGHRACLDYVGRMSAKVSRGEHAGIVVDCTNVTARHRNEWYGVMHQPPRDQMALIFVDQPVQKCIARVRCRVSHPSIPFGRGERIVKGFADKLEPPTNEEKKRFGIVRTIQSKEDMENLLAIWGISVNV